jgi:hypothetical protein
LAVRHSPPSTWSRNGQAGPWSRRHRDSYAQASGRSLKFLVFIGREPTICRELVEEPLHLTRGSVREQRLGDRGRQAQLHCQFTKGFSLGLADLLVSNDLSDSLLEPRMYELLLDRLHLIEAHIAQAAEALERSDFLIGQHVVGEIPLKCLAPELA